MPIVGNYSYKARAISSLYRSYVYGYYGGTMYIFGRSMITYSNPLTRENNTKKYVFNTDRVGIFPSFDPLAVFAHKLALQKMKNIRDTHHIVHGRMQFG